MNDKSMSKKGEIEGDFRIEYVTDKNGKGKKIRKYIRSKVKRIGYLFSFLLMKEILNFSFTSVTYIFDENSQ